MKSATPNIEPQRLGEVLTELDSRLPEYQAAIETQDVSERLQTRLDELHEPDELLNRLVQSKKLLSDAGFKGFEGEAGRRLNRIAAKIAKLRKDAHDAVSSLAKSGAVEANELTQLGEMLESELFTFWSSFVTDSLPAEGILALFERHRTYRSAIARVKEAKTELERMSETLPLKVQDVRAVRKCQERALELFASLPKLKQKYSEFLLGSATGGFPLRELLADQELLTWIQDQNLDEELRVTSGQSMPA